MRCSSAQKGCRTRSANPFRPAVVRCRSQRPLRAGACGRRRADRSSAGRRSECRARAVRRARGPGLPPGVPDGRRSRPRPGLVSRRPSSGRSRSWPTSGASRRSRPGCAPSRCRCRSTGFARSSGSGSAEVSLDNALPVGFTPGKRIPTSRPDLATGDRGSTRGIPCGVRDARRGGIHPRGDRPGARRPAGDLEGSLFRARAKLRQALADFAGDRADDRRRAGPADSQGGARVQCAARDATRGNVGEDRGGSARPCLDADGRSARHTE